MDIYHHQNPLKVIQDGQFRTVAINTLLATSLDITTTADAKVPIYSVLERQIVVTHCRHESTLNFAVLQTDVRPFWPSVLSQLFNQF